MGLTSDGRRRIGPSAPPERSRGKRRACRPPAGSGSGLRPGSRRSATPGGGPAPGAERPRAAAEAASAAGARCCGLLRAVAVAGLATPPDCDPLADLRFSSGARPRANTAPTVPPRTTRPQILDAPKREAHGVSSLGREAARGASTPAVETVPVEARRGPRAATANQPGRRAAFLREGQPDRT